MLTLDCELSSVFFFGIVTCNTPFSYFALIAPASADSGSLTDLEKELCTLSSLRILPSSSSLLSFSHELLITSTFPSTTSTLKLSFGTPGVSAVSSKSSSLQISGLLPSFLGDDQSRETPDQSPEAGLSSSHYSAASPLLSFAYKLGLPWADEQHSHHAVTSTSNFLPS